MQVAQPGAIQRQLPGKSRVPLRPLIANVHTMAGTMAGTEATFRPSGRPYSHMGLPGTWGLPPVQWQDLAYRAASDLDGNPISISWECEDKGEAFPAWSGSDVPPFTPWQVEQLVVGLAWQCKRFAIPPVLLPDSLPGRNGLSYHRLGIDPWRVTGGIRYSSSRGKACPGDRRIAQMPNIVARVAKLVLTGPSKPPVEDDDMPATQRLVTAQDVIYVLPDGTVCDVGYDGERIRPNDESDQAMAAVYMRKSFNAVHIDRAQAVVAKASRARFG